MPYTRAEIDAYVEKNLKLAGEAAQADAVNIRRNSADMIERLPPEKQTQLIERQTTIIAADNQKINEINKEMGAADAEVNGSHYGQNLGSDHKVQRHFNEASRGPINHPIMLDIEQDPTKLERAFRHEVGHNEDYGLNRRHNQAGNYNSEKNQRWNEATQREFNNQRNVDPRGSAEPLYSGAEPLNRHVAKYPTQAERSLEAYAEMSTHHSALHADHGGNQEAINKILEKKYPELWPIYRDEMLPQVRADANELEQARTRKIETYVQNSRELSHETGQAFDEAKVREQAGLSSAAGTIENDNRRMAADTALHRDPVGHYVESQEKLGRERWQREADLDLFSTEKEKPFVFDADRTRAEGESIMRSSGKDALIDRVRDADRQHSALVRLPFGEPVPPDLAARTHPDTNHGTSHHTHTAGGSLREKFLKRAGGPVGKAALAVGIGGAAIAGGASPAEAALAVGGAVVPGVSPAEAAVEGRGAEAAMRFVEEIPIAGMFATEAARPIVRAMGGDVDKSLIQESIEASNDASADLAQKEARFKDTIEAIRQIPQSELPNSPPEVQALRQQIDRFDRTEQAYTDGLGKGGMGGQREQNARNMQYATTELRGLYNEYNDGGQLSETVHPYLQNVRPETPSVDVAAAPAVMPYQQPREQMSMGL